MALNYSRTEVRIGIFICLCFTLCMGLLVFFGVGRISSFWHKRDDLFVLFEDAGGLTPDAPVRYNGLEIGRVNYLRAVHLTEEQLDRMPPLTKHDLENLPLRPASVVHELRDAADADFDTRCRTQLQNRTMIEICLEVQQQGDFKHFRQDDQFRIVCTVFGDTAVEIISGNGPLVMASSNCLMLGTSGDFFSNLAKSMGDVKVILSNVTDVVGLEERKSFTQAQARFGTIQDTLERISNTGKQRADVTLKAFDHLQDDSNKQFADIQKVLDDLQPKVSKAFDDISAHTADMRDRVQSTRETAEQASTELSTDAKKIRTDVRDIIDRCTPNYEAMKTNVRRIYDRMGGLSLKLDGIRHVAGQAMTQSDEDIARAKESFATSVFNLKIVEVVANENKDLMISNKDEGEYEYNTAVNVYHAVKAAVHRLSEARADAMEAQSAAAPSNPGIAARAEAVSAKLGVIRDSVEKVRDSAEDKMLPTYERKKAGWD
jgi:hypothetical protein